MLTFDWTISVTTILAGSTAMVAVTTAAWRMVARICARLELIETGNNDRLDRIETSSMMMEARLEDISRRLNQADARAGR